MDVRQGNSVLSANQSPKKTLLKPSQMKAKSLGKKQETDFENERLKNACSDFEGIFINFMFQAMKKTLPGDGLLGRSHQKEMYDAMFFQEISTNLARDRGIGIGEALYRQIQRKNDSAGENSPFARNNLL